MAGLPCTVLGQTIAYPEQECRALAYHLAAAGPLPTPYKTETQWFREGDLGLKGNQCRISSRGVARKGKDAEARPGIDEITRRVTQVLKRQGFKGEKLLKRYKRDGVTSRAFALRKNRATCWTNLESETVLVSREATKLPAKVDAPVWHLTVDCFLG